MEFASVIFVLPPCGQTCLTRKFSNGVGKPERVTALSGISLPEMGVAEIITN